MGEEEELGVAMGVAMGVATAAVGMVAVVPLGSCNDNNYGCTVHGVDYYYNRRPLT